MQWQDWVFAVGGFMIFASLMPTIRGNDKPALSTAVMTTLLVAVFSTTMLTLGLWLAALANYFCCAAWAILAWQKWRMQRAFTRRLAAEVTAQVQQALDRELPAALEPQINVAVARALEATVGD